MAKAWDEQCSAIDSCIKEGKSAEAWRRISSAMNSRPPREYRVKLAVLARRAGKPNLALRILAPIVRPERKLLFVPTDLEKAEYAATLSRIGAVDEALSLLNSLDGTKLPEVSAYKSLALVSHWRYAETIPLLV